jgi:RNA polymerase sigma-70 factor (ECF subfamily)
VRNPTSKDLSSEVTISIPLLKDCGAESDQSAETWRSDPDVVLMEKVRDGDLESFDVLFRKHSAAVVSLASKFMRSRDRAEEIAQTAFLQLYRARERYEPRARFLTYLYRITTNVCLNELRRREHSVNIESLDAPIDDGATARAPIADEMSEDPEEHFSGVEIAALVQRVLEQLPSNQRTAFMLGRIEGMSYRDVADTMETSVSAVKSLIFRATSTLRSELGEVMGQVTSDAA